MIARQFLKSRNSGEYLDEVPYSGSGNEANTPSMEGLSGDKCVVHPRAEDKNSATNNDVPLKDMPNDQINPDVLV